jgi:hypothetical protein
MKAEIATDMYWIQSVIKGVNMSMLVHVTHEYSRKGRLGAIRTSCGSLLVNTSYEALPVINFNISSTSLLIAQPETWGNLVFR